MAYLYETFYNLDKETIKQVPTCPTFKDEDIEQMERLEVWCSSFSDAGDDWTEFRMINNKNEEIAKKRVDGY
jgi:hypothetical protein